MPILPGEKAPEFCLLNEMGDPVSLCEFSGKIVILYFYPKDDTPGCTKEACNFRDDYSSYQKAGIPIIGISPDSTSSHLKFKNKYELPFILLSDPEHKVCELYRTWGPKKFMGKSYDGVLRTTFLIDQDGIILKTFENVKPAEHSEEILKFLNQQP